MSLAEKIKVLIVDDQVTSRLLLSDALTQLGFKQITAAGDGEQGMKIMEQQPHHLVISDFNMPKMDGLGLLQAVRTNPNTKKAAFIILTAQGDRALVQKAAQLGANNVLAKPFTIEKMKAAIEAVLRVSARIPAIFGVRSRANSRESGRGGRAQQSFLHTQSPFVCRMTGLPSAAGS